MTKKTETVQQGEIARRVLTDEVGQAVSLVLYAPVEEPDGHGDWVCRTEIQSSEGVSTFRSVGIDALQALALGLGSFRYALKRQGAKRLSWGDIEGETGVPLVIQEIDEDFQSLMASLMEAEFARRAMWQKHFRNAKKR